MYSGPEGLPDSTVEVDKLVGKCSIKLLKGADTKKPGERKADFEPIPLFRRLSLSDCPPITCPGSVFNDVFVCTGTFDPSKPGTVSAAPSALTSKRPEEAAGGSKAKGECSHETAGEAAWLMIDRVQQLMKKDPCPHGWSRDWLQARARALPLPPQLPQRGQWKSSTSTRQWAWLRWTSSPGETCSFCIEPVNPHPREPLALNLMTPSVSLFLTHSFSPLIDAAA